MNTELRDELLNSQPQATPGNTDRQEPVAENDTPEVYNRKRYHSSAMYAASKWHSAVKHVKSPNGGHSMLPVQL